MYRSILAAILLLSLVGCGYQSRNTEMVGVVKRIAFMTPLMCPDYTYLDLSLGVVRNGVGSMSTEDASAMIVDPSITKLLQLAATENKIVRVTYDRARYSFCSPFRKVTKVEILPSK